MSDRAVGVAVLGAGFIAEYHLVGMVAARRACLDAAVETGGVVAEAGAVAEAGGTAANVVLRVLAGRSLERATPLAARFGIEAVVTDWRVALERDDVDAVVICTPDDTHEEIAIAAARAGKAILLQKPMAGSVDGCRRIIDAAQRAGVDLQVSFMHRWFPEVEQARQWLAEGVIGRVHSARIRNATPGPDWGDWFFTKSAVANGVVDQLGVHGIDLALQLLGGIDDVSARTATLIPQRTLRDGRVVPVEVADTAFATYGCAGGAMATHEMSQIEVQGCDRFRLELYGDAGTLWLRSERGPLAVYAPNQFGADWHCPVLPHRPLGERHHAAWLDGVAGRAPRQSTAPDALRGMQVVEAIRRSSELGGARVRVEHASIEPAGDAGVARAGDAGTAAGVGGAGAGT
ncbi:MAG: Gfo/Idh/MocA family oxidoreductase [Betaproteobacteria bacterium]